MAPRLLAGSCLAAVIAACGAPPPAGDDAPDARPGAVDAAAPDAEGALFRVQYTDPDHGPFRGGTEIVVRGNGFGEDDEVWIGGRQVLEQEWIDERRFRVITPPGEPGGADVEVRRPGGEIATDPEGFRFDALAIDPPSGSVAGSTFVTITGYGTDFGPGTAAALDGIPLTGVVVQSAESMTGFTPPGTVGDADLVVTTATDVHDVDRAYTYFTTGDPFSGGMSGGPIDGVLNVVVLDNWTRDALPGAFVVVGDPATSPHQGVTDALGQITFSGPDLVGPVTVTATAADHEVASFHCFDAENLTIWLRSPLPPPDTGPPGLGAADGTIRGHVVFGGQTGQGSPFWNLVPEPRTPSETKRIYVTTSASSMFGSPRPPIGPIDYTYDPDQLAWEFEVISRPGAYAVVAVAGLYDPARDPDGNGVTGFEPFALGVTRGVLVGPGELVDGVDVVVDIPLDAAARVVLDAPPPIGTAPGPFEKTLRAWVDLGSDGAIAFGKHGLPFVAGEPLPGQVGFPPGEDEVLVTDAPPRFGTIGNASYTVQVGAYTNNSSPFSIRIERGLPELGAIEIGDFLGVPRPVDPPEDGVASGRRVEFAPDTLDREPTYHMHLLSTTTGQPVWRGVTCGSLYAIELPDLTGAGYAWPPTEQQLVWTIWSVDVVGGDYSQWNYRWLGATYWSGYAADAVYATFPAP